MDSQEDFKVVDLFDINFKTFMTFLLCTLVQHP